MLIPNMAETHPSLKTFHRCYQYSMELQSNPVSLILFFNDNADKNKMLQNITQISDAITNVKRNVEVFGSKQNIVDVQAVGVSNDDESSG